MKKYLWVLVLVLLSSPARAELSEIKLLVNGQPISKFDINQQTRLLMLTSNIQPTEENIKRVRIRAREQLIDNILRYMEANKNNIKVTKEEINQATKKGLRGKQSVENFIDYLKKNGVRASILYNHVRADLSWNKFIEQQIVPGIVVDQNQVDQHLADIKNSLGQTSYLFSQIVLGFENKATEKRARQTAASLRKQLSEGASFDSLMRNFSTGRYAAPGEEQDWVQESDLPKTLKRVLASMQVGQLSPVLRLSDGFYLILLRDIRKTDEAQSEKTMLDLKILRISAKPETAARLRKKVQKQFPGCDQAVAYTASLGGTFDDIGFVSVSDLSKRLRDRLRQAKRDMIIPSDLNGGFQEFLAVCDKRIEEDPRFSRRHIENRFLSEQAFILARKKLLDLRNNASIEKK